MYKLLILFWKKRTAFEKLILIGFALLFIYATTTTIQKGYYKYKYFKSVEKDFKIAQDSISSLNLQLKDLTQKQQITTNKVRKKSKSINDKLKQDENTIDNRDVSNDELDEFLSRYDN